MNTLAHVLALEEKMGRAIIGQEKVVRSIIICLLCDANLLLEGMPGLAKTRAIRSLAENLDATFRRIQFTPDLLPADITGSEIYVPETHSVEDAFQFREGPVFGNLVLVDEINRAPAKVQSALLEAMEERQITVAGKTYALPKLFMALATQNPVEQEGTYNLPEAQLDRFLMKVEVDYPSAESEKRILDLVRSEQQRRYSETAISSAVIEDSDKLNKETIYQAWREVADIHVSDVIKDYIVGIIHASRHPAKYDEELAQWVSIGGSPRATLGLERAARAHAWLAGRDYVDPSDVQAIAYDVLRHRIVLSFQAAAAGVKVENAIARILQLTVTG
ncbi:AAA domain-containing protein [Enterobacteriaceae bacterium RIT691]|uniref:AAA family ATPase n=1 Tax=Scandinavium hiltneri TaxID=2926519 RepID=A0ABT2DWP6_9ENTR|nr:AAA family ATPase [Scandinavium hiltneri]MCS2160049.1 AAA family ATPase [Scandinavium hiltneri]MRS14085.1 AAA domain-containing protein [Enterobacteriaceae bacterium RIT691]